MSPLTIVEQGLISTPDLEAAVLRTRAAHDATLQAYHEVWYNAPHTWHFTQFLGVGIMKAPNDLWVYQDLMVKHRPRTIIETGTYQGGSALWLAALSDLLNLDTRVYSIDIDNYRRCTHPKIEFIEGDSTDPAIAARLAAAQHAPLLVILDADHSTEHVRKELDLYAPMCQIGDWLVVEDTNISWSGEGGDRGAAGAVHDYLEAHPGEWRQDILCERFLTTVSPGGWLQRMA